MRRTVTVAVVSLATSIALTLPATAVTGNYERDFVHTGVGLLVVYDDDGEFAGRCSGTLLTTTVFLTAGHCTDGAADARVYFEQDAGVNFDPELGVDPVSGYPEWGGVEAAEVHTMPGYDDFASFPETRDVGVVILAETVEDVLYGALLDPGSLDRLAARSGKKDVSFTVSGYGVNWINPVQITSLRERMMATATLTNLTNNLTDGYNLAHSGDPGKGKGGTCFGDSGGPVFLAGTNVIAGVTSFGLSAQTCTGPGFAYRTDQQVVHDWVSSLVPDDQELEVVHR
ncbi:trypsin-like serine protease [Nitriliruptor alkaliphilus]|uniref:trypsin-like serine protease n=1 Tax=Nitriliruptor alkaliphilus TaxID=427918 RepID=UPI0014705CE0|nr:trypsin-like serine protease [Nitriliruptor alkaliphilus]